MTKIYFAWHIKKVDINSSVDLLYPVNHPVHGVPLWEAVHQEGGIAPHEQQRKPLVEVADFFLHWIFVSLSFSCGAFWQFCVWQVGF